MIMYKTFKTLPFKFPPLEADLLFESVYSAIESIADDLHEKYVKYYEPYRPRGSYSWELSRLIINEILFDAYMAYKTKRKELVDYAPTLKEMIHREGDHYFTYIVSQMHDVHNNIEKIRKYKKEQWKKNIRIKRIINPKEATLISLDVKYGILHLANHKCQSCGVTAISSPLEVYQVVIKGEKAKLAYRALCDKCKNTFEVIQEP